MSDSTDHTVHAGWLNPELHSELVIQNPAEIRPALRRLQEQRILLTVYIERGAQGFVSALLDVDDDGLVLDASPDEWANRRASSGAHLSFAAQLDGVRVQFELPGASLVTHEGMNALSAPLPEAMLRLQRREAYRLSVPGHSPVGCSIRLALPEPGAAPDAPPAQPVELQPRVIDISTEGLALLFSPADLPLSVGMTLPDALVSLPELEATRVTLRIQNLYTTSPPTGIPGLRAGCKMVGVSTRFAAQIQRYIFKIERERKLLEND